MDLMRARVALRERRLLDVLDLSVRFCGAHAGAYGALALAVLLPAWVVSWAAARRGGWVLGWSVAVGVAAFAEVPFLVLASRLLFEQTVRTGGVLRQSLESLPRVALAKGIELAAFAGSCLFLGLPWLFLGPSLLFVVEVLVLEKASVRSSALRAGRIAFAHFGAALWTLILLALVRIAALAVTDDAGRQLLERILEIRAPEPFWRAGGSSLALLGWWAAVPLVATIRFFEYIDCRTRSEGWDIQTRFAAIAARAALVLDEQRVRAGERS